MSNYLVENKSPFCRKHDEINNFLYTDDENPQKEGKST
jgi:hypothetical protein